MYDILILDARKTKEKYKYSPNNVHFIVPRPPQCHKKLCCGNFLHNELFCSFALFIFALLIPNSRI